MLVIKIIIISVFFFFTYSKNFYTSELKVIDGDTIIIGDEKIRFSGIDAPELDQICIFKEIEVSCGNISKKLIVEKVANQKISCIYEGKDRYQRTLGECFVEGESLSSYLVRQGYAFAYRRYSQKFIEDEEYAKEKKNGMWGMKFIFPWDYRKQK